MDMMAIAAMTTTVTTVEEVLRTRLLHAMREKQGSTYDQAFARRLRVPTRALSAAREGNRPIGIPLLFALVRAYPDLELPVLAYLEVLVDT